MLVKRAASARCTARGALADDYDSFLDVRSAELQRIGLALVGDETDQHDSEVPLPPDEVSIDEPYAAEDNVTPPSSAWSAD